MYRNTSACQKLVSAASASVRAYRHGNQFMCAQPLPNKGTIMRAFLPEACIGCISKYTRIQARQSVYVRTANTKQRHDHASIFTQYRVSTHCSPHLTNNTQTQIQVKTADLSRSHTTNKKTHIHMTKPLILNRKYPKKPFANPTPKKQKQELKKKLLERTKL